jgi:hypothetical protein
MRRVRLWCFAFPPVVAGPPQLMMALTGDGQADQTLILKRDVHCGKDTAQVKGTRLVLRLVRLHPWCLSRGSVA